MEGTEEGIKDERDFGGKTDEELPGIYPPSGGGHGGGSLSPWMEADRPDEGPLFPVGGQGQLRPPRGGGGACGHGKT